MHIRNIHVYIYMSIHTHTLIYTYIYIYLHTNVRIYIYIYIFTHIFIYLYNNVYIYICITIHINTYIHIYIHNHTHLYIQPCSAALGFRRSLHLKVEPLQARHLVICDSLRVCRGSWIKTPQKDVTEQVYPKTLFEIAMVLSTNSGSFPSNSHVSATFSILLRFGNPGIRQIVRNSLLDGSQMGRTNLDKSVW